jgi:hypothetical protein
VLARTIAHSISSMAAARADIAYDCTGEEAALSRRGGDAGEPRECLSLHEHPREQPALSGIEAKRGYSHTIAAEVVQDCPGHAAAHSPGKVQLARAGMPPKQLPPGRT